MTRRGRFSPPPGRTERHAKTELLFLAHGDDVDLSARALTWASMSSLPCAAADPQGQVVIEMILDDGFVAVGDEHHVGKSETWAFRRRIDTGLL